MSKEIRDLYQSYVSPLYISYWTGEKVEDVLTQLREENFPVPDEKCSLYRLQHILYTMDARIADISDSEYEKVAELRKSMKGELPAGHDYLKDCEARVRTIQKMASDGYSMPDIAHYETDDAVYVIQKLLDIPYDEAVEYCELSIMWRQCSSIGYICVSLDKFESEVETMLRKLNYQTLDTEENYNICDVAHKAASVINGDFTQVAVDAVPIPIMDCDVWTCENAERNAVIADLFLKGATARYISFYMNMDRDEVLDVLRAMGLSVPSCELCDIIDLQWMVHNDFAWMGGFSEETLQEAKELYHGQLIPPIEPTENITDRDKEVVQLMLKNGYSILDIQLHSYIKLEDVIRMVNEENVDLYLKVATMWYTGQLISSICSECSKSESEVEEILRDLNYQTLRVPYNYNIDAVVNKEGEVILGKHTVVELDSVPAPSRKGD